MFVDVEFHNAVLLYPWQACRVGDKARLITTHFEVWLKNPGRSNRRCYNERYLRDSYGG
ncbi:hypothetical protein GCM10027094_07860 [Hafnia psychrotolerans]